MNKPIKWLPLSESEFDNTLNCLRKTWNKQVVLNFIDSVDLDKTDF